MFKKMKQKAWVHEYLTEYMEGYTGSYSEKVNRVLEELEELRKRTEETLKDDSFSSADDDVQ